jgi:hypothetical protein
LTWRRRGRGGTRKAHLLLSRQVEQQVGLDQRLGVLVQERDVLVLVALEVARLDALVGEETFRWGRAVGLVEAGKGEVLELVLDPFGSTTGRWRWEDEDKD